ncbi:MAG: hypothetical protein E7618_08200 [Ruminococcaceae bacterium]|nr:hypothetical protein [Oscillospiraceae bacterium]
MHATYNFFLDVPEGAQSLIFRDRATDTKDNEGFSFVSIWHNQCIESEDGQIAEVKAPFGEWFVITNIYDYDEETVTTYINDVFAFTQALPTAINERVDFSDFCYHNLGSQSPNNIAFLWRIQSHFF